MKTTVDLPDGLVKQVKLRARHKGRKFKDAVADLLRKGLALAAGTDDDLLTSQVARDNKTGLPLIECKHVASPHEKLTPDRVADLLLAQEVGWQQNVAR